jgi:hypothetical protein
VALTRDDIDAASITLQVDGDLAFSVFLTRGGLTKRLGSSEGADRDAVMVTGSTDSYFEDFMAAVPDALLERGGRLEDEGRRGPRHDWTFEFAGGFDTLTYAISYHWGSASLPDEFADLVVRAEALTHSWYMARVAEETGRPMPAVRESPSARAAAADTPDRSKPAHGPRAGAAHTVLLTRERLALVVLLDLFALSVPYSFVHWIVVGAAERTGPPGGALMLFAIVEFVLLQIARRSPGYWLLGISAPLGEKPSVDPARKAKESPALLAAGVVLCGLGVGVLTSWTAYHTPVPHFGLSFPLWLSIPITVLGSVALVLAGGLVLRLDMRGVWLGGGLAVLMLLGSAVGWSAWPGFIETAFADWASYMGRPVGDGPPGLISDLAPLLTVAASALLLWGLFESWKRLRGGPPVVPAGPRRPHPDPSRQSGSG